MQLDARGNYVRSPLLSQAPSLENGGLQRGPPFTVTFRIREGAIWDDGSPIISEDFAFTWRAIMHTKGSILAEQYAAIRSIDTTAPKVAVVALDEPTATWPELFGGSAGFVLKRSAFPNANPDRPNLKNRMQDSIGFSGGPWILRSWSKDQAVLFRNERYFGRRTALDNVVFVPRTDQAIELRSLLLGEIAVIFADPSFAASENLPSFRQLGSNPKIKTMATSSTKFEALWFNPKFRPLNDRMVREALMYAIDRQGIVNSIVKPSNPVADVLNCGFVALPDLGPWCATKPFRRFTYDPARSRVLLESTGYDCSSTPCTKNSKPLRVRYITNSANPLDTRVEDFVRSRAAEAGFEIRIVNVEGGVLFGTSGCLLPHDLPVTQCARETRPDGRVTEVLGCRAIPTEQRDFVGENRIGWCNREADRLMKESDRELDPARRLELLARVHEIEVEDLIGLPLFVVPVVSAWRTDRIAGPIGRYASSPYGLFFNMDEWYATT